jgi:hypothetical protein
MPAVKLQLMIINAATEAGVKRFLPSEYGFDLSIPSNKLEKVYGGKIAIAEHLKLVSAAHPGFSYTLLAIGSVPVTS